MPKLKLKVKKAALELIKIYESITEEEVQAYLDKHPLYRPLSFMRNKTNFATMGCTLCDACDSTSRGFNANICSVCIYTINTLNHNDLLRPPCCEEDNKATYMAIYEAQTAKDLMIALRNRTEHIRNVLELWRNKNV